MLGSTRRLFAVLVIASAGLAGCPEREVPKPPTPPPTGVPKTEAAAPAPAAPAPEPSAPAPAPDAAPAATPSATATPAPAPAAKPAAPPKPAAPAQTVTPAPAPAAPAAEPKPSPAAPEDEQPTHSAPTTTARAKVGDTKCRMCHRVQHASWAASPHAAKGIDCEACHGPGADYWPAAIMRDRAKAVAAGLVMPDLASCKKCHPKADEALFARVHAHKAA